MNEHDNLPPLPEYALEFRPRWPGDDGGFNGAQMRDYARLAIAAAQPAQAEPVTLPPGFKFTPQPLTLSERVIELQAALMGAVAALEVVQEEGESLYPATISNALDRARAVLAAAQEKQP